MLLAGGEQVDFDHAARLEREFLLPSNIRTGIVSVMRLTLFRVGRPRHKTGLLQAKLVGLIAAASALLSSQAAPTRSHDGTLEESYDSGIVAPGTGFLLNNEMGDFNAMPGLTTANGLIGTTPNLAAPGKRMLSSMTPTILTKDGRLFLVLGSRGGRTIIKTVLQVILNVVDHRMDLARPIGAPRFHHQWLPDHIQHGQGAFSAEIRAALNARGHCLAEHPSAHEAVMAIRVHAGEQPLEEVADPRAGAAAAVGSDRAQSDAGVGPNLAATSSLPRGQGLAWAFPGDHNLVSHPAVIFADNFEIADFRRRWDSVRDDAGEVLALVDPQDGTGRFGSRSLQVTATLGRNTGGGVTRWFESADPLFVRFYVKFDPTCDYVHHFVTLRANRSLTGQDRWSGFGGAGLRPAGDERFSTALEPWGNWGRWPAPGRWNFYSYWHEMEPSRDGKFWGIGFRPDLQPHIPRNRWICAEFMVKHNTPGLPDGEQAFWIDGELRGHWTGINWRTTAGLQANALTVETYVTDRWTRNPTNIVTFDNVVIARAYIGPSGPRRD